MFVFNPWVEHAGAESTELATRERDDKEMKKGVLILSLWIIGFHNQVFPKVGANKLPSSGKIGGVCSLTGQWF